MSIDHEIEYIDENGEDQYLDVDFEAYPHGLCDFGGMGNTEIVYNISLYSPDEQGIVDNYLALNKGKITDLFIKAIKEEEPDYFM